MKFQGSLACLLLALCLGGGEAGPQQSGGESTGTNIGEAIGHGMEDALSQGVGKIIGKETRGAASSKVSEAVGQGTREAVGTGVRQVPGFGAADDLGNRVGEAAHALGNTGHEIGRQAEDVIRHGADAVHGSWQGVPGHSGTWETSGGHGIFGSQGGLGGQGQGNPGGLGTPWVHEYPGNSAGSFGINPQGAPWGQGGNGGPPNFGTNTQGAVAQPGYGSVRGGNQNEGCTNPPPSGSGGGSSNSGGSSTGSSSGNHGGSGGGNGHKPGCEKPGNEARGTGESAIQGQGSSWGSGGGDAVGGVNTVNSETSPGMFNFDTFWKKFKSKLGFINWDAINKNQVPPPSTRALLYFSRLWEDFKHNTPFLNWKAIIEGADASSLQKRAGRADQPGAGWQEVAAVTSKRYNYNQHAHPTAYGGQYSVKTPAKGGVSPSSSASRVQPGLLQWVKFW
ncbi:dermokine isoform X3 [Nomascus leucogenys]|uniref:dermokine isoform X3 n=1 Tax=Nomascus leucogenys TaxID=61853 RepID=UPI00122D8B53|nr:dermokine isoform X3 [Nomascus leucogenys]